jgi:hypothetical protein
MSSVGAAVAGLTTTVRFVDRTLGTATAVRFLEFISDHFGPLTEAAVLDEITAYAFTKGNPP